MTDHDSIPNSGTTGPDTAEGGGALPPPLTPPAASTGTLPPPGPAPAPAATPWQFLRSRDKFIAGVASGVAKATSIDVTLVRLAFVVSAFSGVGLVVYLVLALAAPRERHERGLVASEASGNTRLWLRVSVGVLAGLGILGLFDGTPARGDGGFIFGVLLIAIGGGVLWWRRRSDDADSSPSAGAAAPGLTGTPAPGGEGFGEPSSTSTWAAAAPAPVVPDERHRVGGAAILARIAGWFIVLVSIPVTIAVVAADNVDAIDVRWSGLFLVLALAGIVNLVAWSSMARRAWPVLASIAALLAIGIMTASVANWRGEVGDLTIAPADVEAVEAEYEFGAGEFTLDLSDIDPAEFVDGTLSVTVKQGMGVTHVIVPDDVVIDASIDVQGGVAAVGGVERDGWNVSLDSVEPPVDWEQPEPAGAGTGTVGIDIDLGFGRAEVCHISDAVNVIENTGTESDTERSGRDWSGKRWTGDGRCS